jgi:hypothetical protein
MPDRQTVAAGELMQGIELPWDGLLRTIGMANS